MNQPRIGHNPFLTTCFVHSVDWSVSSVRSTLFYLFIPSKFNNLHDTSFILTRCPLQVLLPFKRKLSISLFLPKTTSFAPYKFLYSLRPTTTSLHCSPLTMYYLNVSRIISQTQSKIYVSLCKPLKFTLSVYQTQYQKFYLKNKSRLKSKCLFKFLSCLPKTCESGSRVVTIVELYGTMYL